MDSTLSSKSLNGTRKTSIKSNLLAYIRVARPHQYVKNAFIWFPLFFGLKLSDPHAVLNVFWAFVSFSFVASAVYVLNDIQDINEDREHPQKRNRPLASGALSISDAVVFSICLFAASFCVSLVSLPKQFILIIFIYLLLNIFYSFYLKHIAIVDVVCIALGFVLRVIAGGIVSAVPVSHWIIITTFLLAIFLALGKRRDDLLNSCNARKCLKGYTLEFVSLSMVIMTSVVIVAYLLYCVSPEVVQKYGTHDLYFTAFWVIVGLLRYLQITIIEGRSGSPTLIVLQDYFLCAVMVGWILTFYWLIYVTGH